MICGSATTSAYNSVRDGKQGACRSCADHGFKPNRPALIYLMKRNGEQQIGISGSWKARLREHTAKGWVLVETLGPASGHVIWTVEGQLKKWLNVQVGCLPGSTESWSTARLEVQSLKELAKLAGVELPAVTLHNRGSWT